MYGNNISSLTGNLGRDPEIRYFESGKAKCDFSIAVSTGKDKEADWFEVCAWGQSAERAGKLLRKGSRVVVVGSLRQERWQDKQTGSNRSKVVLNAQSIEVIAKMPKSAPGDRALNRPMTTTMMMFRFKTSSYPCIFS